MESSISNHDRSDDYDMVEVEVMNSDGEESLLHENDLPTENNEEVNDSDATSASGGLY